MNFPRMFACMALAVGLLALISVAAPQQLPVALYKLSLVTIAAALGYWIDRWLFPYARPDSYLDEPAWRCSRLSRSCDADYRVAQDYHTVFAAAMLRRALVVLGCMLCVGLGL